MNIPNKGLIHKTFFRNLIKSIQKTHTTQLKKNRKRFMYRKFTDKENNSQ